MSAAHQMDVYQENEELKDELSKLAAKVTRLFSFDFDSLDFLNIIWSFKLKCTFYFTSGWVLQNSRHGLQQSSHKETEKSTLLHVTLSKTGKS